MQTGLGEVPTTGDSQRLFMLVELQIEVWAYVSMYQMCVVNVCASSAETCFHSLSLKSSCFSHLHIICMTMVCVLNSMQTACFCACARPPFSVEHTHALFFVIIQETGLDTETLATL